jgi:hypothetical protein
LQQKRQVSSFAIPKIYISRQTEFSLVLYLKSRQFQQREQDGRSRLRQVIACRIVWLHGKFVFVYAARPFGA